MPAAASVPRAALYPQLASWCLGPAQFGLRRFHRSAHGCDGRQSQTEDIRPAMINKPRVLLRSLFDAAVAAADPARVLRQYLPPPPKGRTIVIGAGKAAAAMARA